MSVHVYRDEPKSLPPIRRVVMASAAGVAELSVRSDGELRYENPDKGIRTFRREDLREFCETVLEMIGAEEPCIDAEDEDDEW